MLGICRGGVSWCDAGIVGAVVEIVPDAGAGDCGVEGAETGVADRCSVVLRYSEESGSILAREVKFEVN